MDAVEKLIATDEFAALAHTSPSTVRYWVHTKYAPPSAKLGRRRVWKESVVHAWIEEQFASEAG